MTTPNRTSPHAQRFLAAGHAARPRPTADLGDPVRADNVVPTFGWPRGACVRATTRRDCPFGHEWRDVDGQAVAFRTPYHA